MNKKDEMSWLQNKIFVGNKNVLRGLDVLLVGFFVALGIIIPSVVADSGILTGDTGTDDLVSDANVDKYARLIHPGWNLLGWFQVYTTDAETFGQWFAGCFAVSMFDASTQTFLSHIVGSPHDNFIIDQGMGVYIYTTYMSIWDGTDGT